MGLAMVFALVTPLGMSVCPLFLSSSPLSLFFFCVACQSVFFGVSDKSISWVWCLGGQIGAGMHASYNPNSTSAILAVAVLNSISAGILLWAGIVELLVHDFLQVRASHRPPLLANYPSSLCVSTSSLKTFSPFLSCHAQCELSTAPWPKVCVALASLLSGAAAMSALANWA